MSPLTLILIVGSGLALVLLVIGIIISVSSERGLVEERLGRYLEEGGDQSGTARAVDSAYMDWINKRVEKSSFGDRMARELARADLKLKVGEYFVLIIGSILGGAALLGLIGRDPISAGLGAIVGAFLPNFYVKRQQKKRLQLFNDQLPDMLNLMVNGLRAGYSTMQAMEAVSKELPTPICDEFRRVVQEMQLGIPMERALDNLLRRIPSEDLDFVITAINVQREVGGNLSEILDTISYTIRERIRIKGEIRVLTSQVRTSGQFMAMIPFGLVAVLWFINRDYIMTFFEPQNILCGSIALAVALFLIIIGYFVMMKIADIEV